MKHKIQLNEIKVKDLSSVGERKHPIKKNKRPYEQNEIKRQSKEKNENPYLRRAMRQTVFSVIIIACVLVLSSVENKVFNDAAKGLGYLVNHEFTFNEVFTVFNLGKDSDSNIVPAVSEGEIIFINPTNGEVISDLLDENDTPVGLVYSVPDGECFCAADGVVFYVDKISVTNPYIRIRHDDGFDTLYLGIIAEIGTGDKIVQGQKIGTSAGDSMGFVLLKNSKYTDIKSYMD